MPQIVKKHQTEIVATDYRVLDVTPVSRDANRWVDLALALVFLCGVVGIYSVGAIVIMDATQEVQNSGR